MREICARTARPRVRSPNGTKAMPSKIIDNADRRVGEIMNKDVHTVVADVDAEAAWHHIRQADIRHLVVLGADDAMVGIISHRDLVAHETLTLARRSVRG